MDAAHLPRLLSNSDLNEGRGGPSGTPGAALAAVAAQVPPAGLGALCAAGAANGVLAAAHARSLQLATSANVSETHRARRAVPLATVLFKARRSPRMNRRDLD